jgi:glycerophosphoryl diester phosphodiesterase
MVSLVKEDGPLVVAHRGASGYMPENTFASFDHALRLGADMIEMDVHPTRDGHLVVMHDETVDRTTDGHGRISSMDLLEVEKLNAAAKSAGGRMERIPTFSDVLDRYTGRIPMMVEVKHGSSIYPGVERKVLEELKKHDALEQVELISFDFECLLIIKRESQSVKTGFIFMGNMASFAEMVVHKVDALHGMWSFVSQAQVGHAKSLGFPVYLWTVNSEADIAEALRLGADGIVSNYPDRVLNALGRPGPARREG